MEGEEVINGKKVARQKKSSSSAIDYSAAIAKRVIGVIGKKVPEHMKKKFDPKKKFIQAVTSETAMLILFYLMLLGMVILLNCSK